MRYRKSILILSVFSFLFPSFAWAYPAEVPRTGQTACYDSDGYVIACNETGQDGEIQAGVAWPDPRFADRGNGTVSDNLTGIMWSKDAGLMKTRNPDNDTDGTAGDGAITWQHALDYIKRLNRENYLGHTDWRLPNVNELESLMNVEHYNPALPQRHPFTNVRLDYYWSSTYSADYTDQAWLVGMAGGDVLRDEKANNYYVWPVRAGECGFDNAIICLPKTGQIYCYNTAGSYISCAGTGQDGDIQAGVAWPDPRFNDRGDGTVLDNLTGLVWAKNANIPNGAVDWQVALYYVADMNAGKHLNFGHTDWRLPNRRELRSLPDYGTYDPALPWGHPFTNVHSCIYWSSTTYSEIMYAAGTVGMYDGSSGGWYKVFDPTTYPIYVWPVRAGYIDNSTIFTTTTSVISTTTTTTGSGSTTTTTTGGGKPCPAKQVLGADNPKLEQIRDFRNSKLTKSAIGRKVIQIYYNNADSINAALDRSPALKAVTRRVLEVIAPMVGKK